MSIKKTFGGIITGCTIVRRHPLDREVTTFYVQPENQEDTAREWNIHGRHEILLPGRRITLEYNLNSSGWADNYTLFDEKGNEIYKI